jgi:hypothetical protein
MVSSNFDPREANFGKTVIGLVKQKMRQFISLICHLNCVIQLQIASRNDIALQTAMKEKIFNYSIIFFPINRSAHWTLLVLQLDQKTGNASILHLDSLGENRQKNEFIRHLLYFLAEISKRYTIHFGKQVIQQCPTPQQTNGYDCGVFVCVNAKCLAQLNNNARNEYNYSQSDIQDERKMVKYLREVQYVLCG